MVVLATTRGMARLGVRGERQRGKAGSWLGDLDRDGRIINVG